jgi:hypothetical protein
LGYLMPYLAPIESSIGSADCASHFVDTRSGE